MAPPTCTTSPAPSTTIAGARRSPGATRSTPTPPIKKASGPDGNGGLINVAGDFRELQGTMWAHDHRFFFTAENVYKGMFMMVNYYSGPDRGNEKLTDGVNLQAAERQPAGLGQYRLRRQSDHLRLCHRSPTVSVSSTSSPPTASSAIFRCVNLPYAPFMEVLPRKYRFRILNACMSRFFKLALVLELDGGAVPVHRQRRQSGRQPDRSDWSWTSRASPSATTSSSTSPGSASATAPSRQPAEADETAASRTRR